MTGPSYAATRAPSSAGATAARRGGAASLSGALGAALAPQLGISPVEGAALVGGVLTAVGGALGKLARDRVHSGHDGALWAFLAALL